MIFCHASPRVLFALKTVCTYAALVVFSLTFVVAQNDAPKPVEDVFAVLTQDALTRTIAERSHRAWAALKKQDASAFAALTTDDYRAVLGNGAMHFYRPTSQELAALNLTQYTVSQFQAVPIGRDGALVTYVVFITIAGGGPGKLAYGEVWLKQGDEWKCQYSQATVTP